MKFPREKPRTREEYERGLPGYHDPTSGYGGAAPAYSALTLRLVLSALGFVVCVGGAVLFGYFQMWWISGILGILAVGAVIDFLWVLHRKQRGEPG
ncbi:hypothetical protein FNH05_34435 [Amycolatopsis rhizosphaerae]|uniref:Uncharacterized protein n=1 Tax=Amycolatopsis rhizosphaerae TaxID=2053003 RepID=A0A558A8H2_9PSEU|nr:DUF6343 family protein [Amycolatopsis rhizosphaerae]TVT20559.1 hypothetical protein FNH05_34435 [Amycolatopsis rhizosphaerae]